MRANPNGMLDASPKKCVTPSGGNIAYQVVLLVGTIFFKEIAKYPFLICAHGGGIDPNPNAWSALLAGTIPIIQRFAGDSIYDDLPVILVEQLPSDNLTMHNLRQWRDRLAPMFEGEKRKLVVEKLMTNFWWNKIISKLNR